jgi:hypothetical protein
MTTPTNRVKRKVETSASSLCTTLARYVPPVGSCHPQALQPETKSWDTMIS